MSRKKPLGKIVDLNDKLKKTYAMLGATDGEREAAIAAVHRFVDAALANDGRVLCVHKDSLESVEGFIGVHEISRKSGGG